MSITKKDAIIFILIGNAIASHYYISKNRHSIQNLKIECDKKFKICEFKNKEMKSYKDRLETLELYKYTYPTKVNMSTIKFKDEDELWSYIEKKYDEESELIIVDLASYYETEYCDNYNDNDIEKYNRCKEKDITGELDILAKMYFELIKPNIDKNLNKNSK
jgi:hypothetical protein